jgi:hypothetical protein
MSIPAVQAQALFTKAYLTAYSESVPAPMFYKSFFTTRTFETKSVSIQVERAYEAIAVDVLRGVDGNRNTFSRYTEKEFIPPYYSENFDATQLDRYDVLFGADPSFTPSTIGFLARNVADKYNALRAKIDRAKEKQCADVLNTGIITLKSGDSIDYKRKATSKVDLTGAGGYWSTTSTDVEAQLVAGAGFIRTKGRNSASEFHLIMSGTAWTYLKKTTYFTTLANFQQVQLLDVTFPVKNAAGQTYAGRIVAGAYLFNVWLYDEVYDDFSTGSAVSTRYMAANKAVMIPVSGTRFELVHAGVPAIIRDVTRAEFSQYITNQASEYWLNNYIDEKAKAHVFEIYSAPLAIPVSVDQIYTMQVTA